MSGFGDYNNGFDNSDGYNDDGFSWDGNGPGPVPDFNRGPGFNRRARYNNAYGDYSGGYGPIGGFHGPRPLMMAPMPPPLPQRAMWGRGFPGRRNAFDNRAIKYLQRCGMLKENLKNLPSDLLELIQPEYCGLCDFNFDSFTQSRMHYNSRNHLKNQKKWLSRGKDSYKEAPLKSRELYCELCDIEITSKPHGEAHYAGKPHRGIVDGRKKPKNPMLLQESMSHRLEQLIRREKRCLKNFEDTPKEEQETVKAEPKITAPELYCEICKTAVTCSEQMTMHMNGKKHLAKEKHHILTMMKGKTDDEDKCENMEEEDAANEEDEQKGTESTEKADNEEWGTEAWDQDQGHTDTIASSDY